MPERKRDIERLLNEMSDAMSAAVLLDQYPLCSVSREQRDEFRPVLHQRWLEQFDIVAKLRLCSETLAMACAAHEKLALLVHRVCADERTKMSPSDNDLQKALEEAVRSSTELARAIEDLPSEILVP